MASSHDLKRPNFTDERIFTIRLDSVATPGDPGWIDFGEGYGLLIGGVTVPSDRWWKLDSAYLIVTEDNDAAVTHPVDAIVAVGDEDWEITSGIAGLWYTLGQTTDHTLVQDTLLPCTTNPNVWLPSGWKIQFICGELPVVGISDRFMVTNEKASLIVTGRAFTLQED
jgi:hypothetical protein